MVVLHSSALGRLYCLYFKPWRHNTWRFTVKKTRRRQIKTSAFTYVPSLQLTHHCQCLLQQCYNFKKQEETVSSSDTAGDGSKALLRSLHCPVSLENRTLLTVPTLDLWFSDSVVWTQCAHTRWSHTANFDLLVSTPQSTAGSCSSLPAVTLRATDCTVLLNDGVHWGSDKTVTFLCLCVMNTCTCNCLCVLVCVFAWRSEWLPVICLWGSPSWFPIQEFPTDPGACCFNESPAYPCHHLKLQPTVGSSCVGVEVSGPQDCTISTDSLSHIHGPLYFFMARWGIHYIV